MNFLFQIFIIKAKKMKNWFLKTTRRFCWHPKLSIPFSVIPCKLDHFTKCMGDPSFSSVICLRRLKPTVYTEYHLVKEYTDFSVLFYCNFTIFQYSVIQNQKTHQNILCRCGLGDILRKQPLSTPQIITNFA